MIPSEREMRIRYLERRKPLRDRDLAILESKVSQLGGRVQSVRQAAQPVSGCVGAVLTVHVVYCGGNLPGTFVELLSGGVTVDSGTTDGGGLVAFAIPAAGAYSIRASRANYTTQTHPRTLACSNTSELFSLVAAPGYVNLAGCVDPWEGDPATFRFALTDHLGTIELDHYATSGTGTAAVYTYTGCRSFTTRWGRDADCHGDLYGSDIPATSAVYYELGLSCTTKGLTLYYPTCDTTGGSGGYCTGRVIPAACGPDLQFRAPYQPTGGTIQSSHCPPAFAMSGRWQSDAVIFGGATIAQGCNLGLLFDKSGDNPYFTPGSDPMPAGYDAWTLSQL